MQRETTAIAFEPASPEWRDGGIETAPLALEPAWHAPATEADADPSWRVL